MWVFLSEIGNWGGGGGGGFTGGFFGFNYLVYYLDNDKRVLTRKINESNL